MYETLVEFLPMLSGSKYGEWVTYPGHAGTREDPLIFLWVKYDKCILGLCKAVYLFVDEHRELDLRSYEEILGKSGIKWNLDSMSNADVSVLDGTTVMALLVATVRAERFCDGALLQLCNNGSIAKWLERLKEIDEERELFDNSDT